MRSRRIALYLLTAVFSLSLIEAFSYVAGRLLEQRGIFYSPHDTEGLERYLAERDPVLGWPSPASFGTKDLDRTGARVTPAFPEPGGACVSLYGDSFTFGVGVRNEDAFGNLLSLLLGCRVANYGTPGYGSDQATLRFERNEADEAPVVILVHLTENIARNVNQVRQLVYAGNRYGLKPRFALRKGGGLELVPLADITPESFEDLMAHPQRHLRHEYFLPGGDSGIEVLRFPFSLSVLMALDHFHVRAALRRRPWYTEFYAPDHPSQGLEVTARILARFDRIARERGKTPLLVLMPTGLDLEYYARTGNWVQRPLVELAARRGLALFDLGPAFIERTDPRDPCAFYNACDGHLNARGNEIVASLIATRLEEDGL